MEKIHSRDIRNVCLLGHGASGKTSLAEAMLYLTKATDRLGKPTDGNTVCDYDPEEVKRGFSLSASIAPVTYKGTKINIIDTPGYLDFIGEAVQALRVAGSALIVVDGKAGVEVGTELAWDMVCEAKMPRAFFINKCDDPEARFKRVFGQMHEMFGQSVCPVIIPVMEGDKIVGLLDLIEMKAVGFGKNSAGKEIAVPAGNEERIETCRNMLYEAVASTSEELMEKYFSGETLSREEVVTALHGGILRGDIAPVVCGSATNLCGIDLLMDLIVDTLPSPVYHKAEIVVDGGEEKEVPLREHGPASIFVFKTIADPFVGKLCFFRVYSGKVETGSTVYNSTKDTNERMGRILQMHSNHRQDIDCCYAGDIAACVGVKQTTTGDTLCDAKHPIILESMEFPEPVIRVAIEPKTKAGQEKMSIALAKLAEEDPTFKCYTDEETGQTIIAGMGELHLEIIVDRMLREFRVEANVGKPQVAYRETITKTAESDTKYSRQSGGKGQYGHVKIRIEPNPEKGFEFVNNIVGGAIPKEYFNAIEAGIKGAMLSGVLAGFNVVDVKVTLFDGSYHEVDSSEMAFKIAASMAFKDAMKKAGPVLMEPIMKTSVIVPDEYMGDVIGDINSRRGTIQGTETRTGAVQINAFIPLSNMFGYATALRSKTQGRGQYVMEPSHYTEVPKSIAEKIVSEK